jgi:hypothetical protein
MRQLLDRYLAVILIVYFPLTVFLLALGVRAVLVQNDYSLYFRDPAAVTQSPPWTGLFSNIGVLLWCGVAVVSLFTAVILRRIPGERRLAGFFLAWGLLTIVLMLDDLFMIHEFLLPTYFPVSDDIMFVAYFLAVAGMLIYYRTDLSRMRYILLGCAFAAFGASITLDVLGHVWFTDRGVPTRLVWNLEYVIENGLKLLGIVLWLHFFTATSLDNLYRVMWQRNSIQEAGREQVEQYEMVGD